MAGMLLLNFEALLSIKKRTVLDFPFPTDHSWSLYDSINVSSFKHLKHLKKKVLSPVSPAQLWILLFVLKIL